MTRILYSGTRNASSWAFRAWLALKELNIDFVEEIIDIRRPQRWDNLSRIGKFSVPAALPLLIDDGFVIADSSAIMEYANELGGNRLLPKDIKLRARARALVAWQHSTLGRDICGCLSFESTFYPQKKSLTHDEVLSAQKLYCVWEKDLKDHGGPYLVGELSLADIAFLPTVLRLTSHLPIGHDWPLTAAWVKRLIARGHVQQWLAQAYELPPIYHEGYTK
jgi:glutathione S-transferase